MVAQGRHPMMLLDTNIWLDYYDPFRPDHSSALALIDHAYSHEEPLTYCPTSLKDFFYLFARAQKERIRQDGAIPTEEQCRAINECAWACVENLQELATPVSIGLPTLWRATKLKGIHPDLEDDIILAACELAEVDFLVTSDEKMRQRSLVPALTAEGMLARLQGEPGA